MQQLNGFKWWQITLLFFTHKISDPSDIENESHLGYFSRITTGAFRVFILNLKCKKTQQMKLPSRHASSAIISYLCTKFKQEIYTCIYHRLTNWFVILKKWFLNCWILQIVHAQTLHIFNLNSQKHRREYWYLYFLYRNNMNLLVNNIVFARLTTDSEYPEVTRNTLKWWCSPVKVAISQIVICYDTD